MKTLRQLVEALDTVTVRLAGQEFKARVMTALECDLIGRFNPSPRPPEKPDPNFAGSLAPTILDENDPDYLAAADGWFADYAMCIVAAAIGHEGIGTVAQWPSVTTGNHRSAEIARQAKAFCDEARPILAKAAWRDIRNAFDVVIDGPAQQDARKN